MYKNKVFGLVFLVVFWLIAGLIMWGAVATGQYFFGLKDAAGGNGPSGGAMAGGVLIPLLFIVPISLTFFGLGAKFMFAGIEEDMNANDQKEQNAKVEKITQDPKMIELMQNLERYKQMQTNPPK